MTKQKEKKKVKKIKKQPKNNIQMNKIKQHVIQVVLLSLIIFSIIFFIYQIISLAMNPTDSFLVDYGKVSQEESLIGYVIRDEKLIQAPENQTKLVQIKNEGDRVSVGEAVFRYEAPNEQELNTKIEELNNEIQKAMEGQTEIFSSDIKALENQIATRID